MKSKIVQLISVSPSVGRGANDGAYYPVGLLTIASALDQVSPKIQVSIHDQCHGKIKIVSDTDLVGISVPSSLCYENALLIAQEAKAQGKIVVLGGQYATHMAEQILRRQSSVDFIIRGKGEIPFVDLINGKHFEDVLGLSWRRDTEIIHNCGSMSMGWGYDNYAPLPLNLLTSGIEKYWEKYRENIDSEFEAALVVFTHFGCLYRQRMVVAGKQHCSFCSLDDVPMLRSAQDILSEIREYVEEYEIPRDARVRLKCYGDNIGPYKSLVKSLADEIEKSLWWSDYRFSWTFYCQSSFVSDELIAFLKRIGTTDLFIGFDSANNQVQKLNGLGTSNKTHGKAVLLCEKYGIKLQASSVLGLIGETPETLEEQYRFFMNLWERGVLERINSGVIILVPGSLSYQMLIGKEPWLKELDFFSPQKLQELWIKHFCPKVSLAMLTDYATKIDRLSPGPHANMGFDRKEDKLEDLIS